MIQIVIDGYTTADRAKIWCHDNFGIDWGTDDTDGRWTWQVGRDRTTAFQFKDEQDAVLFALRWL